MRKVWRFDLVGRNRWRFFPSHLHTPGWSATLIITIVVMINVY